MALQHKTEVPRSLAEFRKARVLYKGENRMSRKVGILSADSTYGEIFARELGRALGAGWQTGSFSDAEQAFAWLSEKGSLLLYEGEPEVPEDSGCLRIPLLEEEPEVPKTRFSEDAFGIKVLPGIYKYRRTDAVCESIKDIRTLSELRNRTKMQEQTQVFVGEAAGEEAPGKELPEAESETGDEIPDRDTEGPPKCAAETYGDTDRDIGMGTSAKTGEQTDEGPLFPEDFSGPEIICVTSPGGGTGVTALAAAFTAELAKTGRSVLLSFDLCPGAIAGARQEISEVLYRIREYGENWISEAETYSHSLKGRLSAEFSGENGALVIAGMAGARDLWEWTPEVWKVFFAGMRRLSVEFLVIDLGAGVMAEHGILSQAKRLLVIGDTDGEKVRQWKKIRADVCEHAEFVSFAASGGKSGKKLRPETLAAGLLREKRDA